MNGQLDRRVVEVADLDRIGTPGQREYAVYIGRAAQEDESATEPTSVDAGVDDGVDARTVHERELAQVEQDESRLLLRLAQRPLQLRCRREIQLARDVHPGSVQAAVRAGADKGRRRRIDIAGDRIGGNQGVGHIDTLSWVSGSRGASCAPVLLDYASAVFFASVKGAL